MSLRSRLALTLFVPALVFSGCGDDDDIPLEGYCLTGTVVTDGGCTVADAGEPMENRDDAGGKGGTGGDDKPGKGLSCGEGTVEEDGECVAVPEDDVTTPQKAPVGGACKTKKDCVDGTQCLTGETLPGNFCTVINCDMDTPCPVGSACYQATETSTICMPYCDDNSSCREGYNCQPLYTNAINICTPSCKLTGACPSGTHCNEDNGLCEIAGCDPTAKKNKCEKDETCWPDTKGLSEKGGLCLHLCDPQEPNEECLPERNEVCQPLASDPENEGFCATPVCSKTEECPAGAVCHDSVCQPPALCDEDDECDDDDSTCVAGKCMTKCPHGGSETCADLHPDLACATGLEEPACLPVGSFPGSACRSGDACSDLAVGDDSVPMVCQDDVCLPECGIGGDALCAAISDTLACAVGIFDDDLCVPKGTFPGSPCGPSDYCAEDLEGNTAVDMQCVNGRCLIGCDEGEQFPGYGDALCQIVDPSLTCSSSAGEFCVSACAEGTCGTGFSCLDAGSLPTHENACLPNGTFPGSACGGDDADECYAFGPGLDQTCVNHVCTVVCDTGDAGDDDALCGGVDPSLTCSESAGNICVLACDDDDQSCSGGYSCLNPGDENACLPTGSFPGSPCRDTQVESEKCLPLGQGVNQVCVNDACVVSCDTAGDDTIDDGLCVSVDPSLTCSESAGHLCVLACDDGDCSGDFSCLDEGGENACLPNGSFPGSACRPISGEECDDLGTGETMICVQDTCVIDCSGGADAAANDAICTRVDGSLTCSETAGDVCVRACDDGACGDGFSCLKPDTENACLPDGTFPGSTCRAEGTACDTLPGDITPVCVQDTCLVSCATGGNAGQDDAYCGGVGAALGIPGLTCSETAGKFCVLACDDGDCDDGFSCLKPDTENACLPDGTFPGSTCRTSGTACDTLAGDLTQACVQNTCLVTCNTGGTAGQDDAMCNFVGATLGIPGLTCSETAGKVCVLECDDGACDEGFSCLKPDTENACLPDGTFPGSACRNGTTCDSLPGNITQACVQDTCLVTCATAGTAAQDDTYCGGVGAALGIPGLTCSETAGDVCVLACDGGACDDGFSCLSPGTENACLPDGTFPGSACRDGTTCDPISDGVDQTCAFGTCAIDCEDALPTPDLFCGGVGTQLGSPVPLTCFETLIHACVPACQGPDNLCPPGFTCQDTSGSKGCLPN